MAKTRVGVLLRETMGGNKSTNRSADLTALTARYHDFCKRIHGLILALKGHHDVMQKMEASRQQVAQRFGAFTKDTPLFDCIGLMPSAERPSSTVCSYMSVHDDLAAKAKSYAGKYQQFVLEYAIEWEKVIRTRIDNGIKKAEELRIELDHYQKKTEALRLAANQAMAKGKPVPSSQQEKLTRNEEKFIESKQNYNRVATDVCILMEEVTERSWRDLHPLLVKVAQFDMTLANDEAKALAPLSRVVSSLKQVATDNGLSAQPRLKDLAGLKPELLSTRPGGVAGLAIEAGPFGAPGTGTAQTSSFEQQQTALPPGSVGPQGMGGYPVQISPPSNNQGQGHGQFGRSNSVTSFHSAPMDPTIPAQTFDFNAPPSTMSMLAISTAAAPAPTMDDVYGNYNHPSSTRSAPSSGNYTLPPLPPSTNTTPTGNSSWNVRSSSFNDADSNYSGFSAPTMPPPSMPPPPPPPMPPSYGAPSASPWSTGIVPHQQQQQQQHNPMSYYPGPPQGPPPQQNPNHNPFGY